MKYHTSASPVQSDYDRHFLSQIGHYQVGNGSIPVYHGVPIQHGYGLGNFIASAFRRAIPILKKGAVFLGKKFLKTGARVAEDVASGVPIRDSLKSHGTSVGKETILELNDAVKQKMSGSGHKRSRKRKRLVSTVATRKKRTPFFKSSDIFSKI